MDTALLDLYTDYLLSSFGKTTATGLARLMGAGFSHDTITRFLSKQDFTSADLWHVVKPMVRTTQTEQAVLIIDPDRAGGSHHRRQHHGEAAHR